MVVRGGSGGGSGGGYSSGSSGSSGGGGGAGLLGARLRYIWILRAPTIIRCLSLCLSFSPPPLLLSSSPSPSLPSSRPLCVCACVPAGPQSAHITSSSPTLRTKCHLPTSLPPTPTQGAHTHTHTHTQPTTTPRRFAHQHHRLDTARPARRPPPVCRPAICHRELS